MGFRCKVGLVDRRGAGKFCDQSLAMALLASLARLGWRTDGWRQEAEGIRIGSNITTIISIISAIR